MKPVAPPFRHADDVLKAILAITLKTAALGFSLDQTCRNGADWNGEVEVAVKEEWSGQTYLVRFDRPIERPALARVTIRDLSGIDPQYAVREAILRYARGEIPGERGLIVGANVSPFEFSWAINHDAPEIHVSKLEVSFDGENWQTEELAIALNEKATITAASILVIVQP